jgi:cell division protein FtsI (penicillin-binding protein 3)
MTGLLWKKLAGLSRPVVIAFTVAAMFGVIAMRGSFVALSGQSDGGGLRNVQHADNLPKRADIIDRNGELLATTVAVYSLFADPRAIWDANDAADQYLKI